MVPYIEKTMIRVRHTKNQGQRSNSSSYGAPINRQVDGCYQTLHRPAMHLIASMTLDASNGVKDNACIQDLTCTLNMNLWVSEHCHV